MTQATIVDWIEEQNGVRFDLSEPTKTHLDRLWHVMVSNTISDADLFAVDRRRVDYLESVDADERLAADECYLALQRLLLEQHQHWRSCPSCGHRLCPHCHDGD